MASKKSNPDNEESAYLPLTLEEETAAIRKIDRRLIPLLAISYFVLKTDSGNLNIMAVLNADKGHSLRQHLHLTSGQWAWALSAFFYSNGFFEPLSNLLFKYFTPSKWLGRILVTWGRLTYEAEAAYPHCFCLLNYRNHIGAITMLGALIKNFAGVISIRFFLGVVQAGFGSYRGNAC